MMAASKGISNIVVIGVGIAGNVRIRDLKQSIPAELGLNLVGFVSRRKLEIEGVRQMELDEALDSKDVDAVAVCTEPGKHAETVEKALLGNKHVLVEYPVASSPDKATELYNLAQQKGLVLHEENIALLTETFTQLKEKIASSPPLKHGQLRLKGNYNGWIEDFQKSGLPFTTNVSVIQSVIAAFGDVKAVGASFEKTDDGYKATGNVQTQNGAVIQIVSERYREKVSRVKSQRFEFEDGSVFDGEGNQPSKTGLTKKQGLFMQDLRLFAGKVHGTISRTQGSELTIKSLEVASQLNTFIADQC